ncbi:MAG: hypothetical protein JKY60_01100 [Kordiimonadaceae bacterium]|nr:hypothetical protein [Kordiimonadaceae bacterium]
MKQFFVLICSSVLAVVFSGAANAQDFYGQQDRASYAGAYFSMSLGEGKATQKPSISYGFTAGFRQNFSQQPTGHFRTAFNQEGTSFRFSGDRDWKIHAARLDFSGRGFENLSFAGLKFVQKDASGEIRYIDDQFRLVADGEDGTSTVKIVLWTALGLGVAGLAFMAACQCPQ